MAHEMEDLFQLVLLLLRCVRYAQDVQGMSFCQLYFDGLICLWWVCCKNWGIRHLDNHGHVVNDEKPNFRQLHVFVIQVVRVPNIPSFIPPHLIALKCFKTYVGMRQSIPSLFLNHLALPEKKHGGVLSHGGTSKSSSRHDTMWRPGIPTKKG